MSSCFQYVNVDVAHVTAVLFKAEVHMSYTLFFQFKQAVYKQTMKLFAELAIKRKEREAKEMHER